MCEQCKFARVDVIRDIVLRARPEQIQRLLRDIRRIDSGGEPEGGVA